MDSLSVFGAIVVREQQHQDILGYFDVEDWRAHRVVVESRLGGFRPEDVYPDLDGPAPPADGRIQMEGRSLACYVAEDMLC